jgi:ATP-dependent RNA helicase DDX55/SPB4
MEAFRACQTPRVLLATDLIARGIDVADVNWIVQFDCPQDPSFFVHRVGRTARAGREGSALAMLLPNEAVAYIAFLAKRGVVLTERIAEGGKAELEPSLVRDKLTSVKREILMKATAAFVSFVRAYQAHVLSFIFSTKELDLGDVATSFSVLRIPRVKEILGKKFDNFTNHITKPDDVPFSDTLREKQRQKQIKVKEDMEQKEYEEKLNKESEKKEAKASAAKRKVELQKQSRSRSDKRKATRENREAEWDDLQKEERLAKKLRARKITQKEFDRLLLDENSSDSDNC